MYLEETKVFYKFSFKGSSQPSKHNPINITAEAQNSKVNSLKLKAKRCIEHRGIWGGGGRDNRIKQRSGPATKQWESLIYKISIPQNPILYYNHIHSHTLKTHHSTRLI